jgi:hypothetical protein
MAQKIYVGQTALAIQLDTTIDLTTMTVGLIKYMKPDGTTGQWTAVEDDPGVLSYTVQSSSDLDMEGTWKWWAYVTFVDGSYAPGDPVTEYVYTEGS